MSRSLPSKGDLKVVTVKEKEVDVSRGNVSSSSVDPSSSIGNTNSSNAPSSDGSILKQTWPSQSQMEEKVRDLERIQEEVGKASFGSGADNDVTKLLEISDRALNRVKEELGQIKPQAESDRKEVLGALAELTGIVALKLKELEPRNVHGETTGILEQEITKRTEAESELEKMRSRLETEMQKLEDCHREIDIYRYQLEDATKALDTSKADSIELKAEQEEKLVHCREEHEALVALLRRDHADQIAQLEQKLALEHELELDALKQHLKTEDTSEAANAKGAMDELEAELALSKATVIDLRTKVDLLEINNEEKINEEKEKIVQILEAGFSERQRVALYQLEKDLKDAHEKELLDIHERSTEETSAKLEELRQKMVDTGQTTLKRAVEKKEREMKELLRNHEQKLRAEFQLEKEEIELLKEREKEENTDLLRKKSKMELDSLRSRFRMMQTTSTIDRSPSVSESELSFEIHDGKSKAPSGHRVRCYSTGEFFKSGRAEGGEGEEDRAEDRTLLERSTWLAERERLNKEIELYQQQLRDKEILFSKEKEEIKKSEKLRNGAEKQVMFNEAIRKAVDEKDRQIEELENRLLITRGNQERTQSSDLELQLGEVSRKNAQLESELREAEQRMTSSMSCSIAPVREDTVRQLQQENKQLKDQLSKSMTTAINNDKVSITSADRGDIVLVVWSEAHSNYSIYQEGSTLHFLHTDCLDQLGLGVERGVPRKKYSVAEVVEKEYCHAKKPENRFRLPQGTKFYRVRCRYMDREQITK